MIVSSQSLRLIVAVVVVDGGEKKRATKTNAQ